MALLTPRPTQSGPLGRFGMQPKKIECDQIICTRLRDGYVVPGAPVTPVRRVRIVEKYKNFVNEFSQKREVLLAQASSTFFILSNSPAVNSRAKVGRVKGEAGGDEIAGGVRTRLKTRKKWFF